MAVERSYSLYIPDSVSWCQFHQCKMREFFVRMSFLYVRVTRKKLPKRHLYEKFACFMLIKLTTGRMLILLHNLLLSNLKWMSFFLQTSLSFTGLLTYLDLNGLFALSILDLLKKISLSQNSLIDFLKPFQTSASLFRPLQNLF